MPAPKSKKKTRAAAAPAAPPEPMPVLCLPALVPAGDAAGPNTKGVTDVVLKPGLSLMAFANGKLVGPVRFTGNRNAFVNALGELVAPTCVRTKSRDVESELTDGDGVKHLANIPEHTVYLVDG